MSTDKQSLVKEILHCLNARRVRATYGAVGGVIDVHPRGVGSYLGAQLRIASDAGDPVTRPELEAALAVLKTDLMERMSSLGWRLVGIVIAANAVLLAAVKLIP